MIPLDSEGERVYIGDARREARRPKTDFGTLEAQSARLAYEQGEQMTIREQIAWQREAADGARRTAELCRKAGHGGNAALFEKLARSHERLAEQIERVAS